MLRGSPSERKACTTSGIPPRAVRVSSSGSGSSSKGKGEAVGEALGILRIEETTQQFSHPAGEKSEHLPALPPNSRVKGRTAEAMRTIQEALDIARRNREKRSEARALVNLGSIRIQTGDTAQGWQGSEGALAYYRQGSFRTEAAIALILLGRAARDKDDYDGARRAFEETLATMKPAGPSLPLALAQEGLASLEVLQDRWPQALRMFDETRRAFEAIGNSSGTATNELNVALMHAMLGHKGGGTAAPQQAVDSNSVSALQIILMQERFGEARAKAEALLRSADASDLETRRGASLVLGLALARSGAGARGLEACRKAFDLAHAAGNPAAEAEALLGSAEAALAAGDRRSEE